MADPTVRVVVKADDQASGPLNKVAANIRSFRESSEQAGRGLGKIGNILGDISREALGATGPLGRIGEKLLELGIGGGAFIVATGAIAGLVGIFSELSKETRKAQEAYDNWLKSLQNSTPLAIVGAQIESLQHKLDNMDDSFLGRATRFTRSLFATGDKKSLLGKLFGVQSAEEIQQQLDEATKQYADLLKSFTDKRLEIAAKAEKELTDKRRKAFIEQGTDAAERDIRNAGGPQVIRRPDIPTRATSADQRVDPGQLPFGQAADAALSFHDAMALITEITPNVAAGLDAINDSLLGQIPGFNLVARAAQKAVQIVAKVEGTIAIAKGAVKLAESIWPFNPAGIASGTKMIAEGAKLSALGGGGGGTGGGGGGGVGGGPSFSQGATAAQQAQRDRLDVMLPPVIPTTDPGVQDWLADLIRNAQGRDVRFSVGVR